MGDRAHERLVAELHVAVDHIEMPLVDGQVDRLADRATGVVQTVGHVSQLDEILEILDARVATTFIEVANERRTVGGGEYGIGAADDHVVGRVARVLREFPRRGRLDQRAAQCRAETAPVPR